MNLPLNREAEEALLGAVLVNPLVLFECQFLKSEDFGIHRFGWMWEAFKRLEERHEDINNITVSSELERTGQLREFGGNAEITRLCGVTTSTYSAPSHARLVQRTSMRRQIILTAQAAAVRASKDDEPSAIIGETRTKLDAITDLSDHKLIPFGQLLGDTYASVEARSKDPKDIWGLKTGLPKFDKETGGIQQGELTYVIGSPAVGKTWSLLGWGFEFGKEAPGVWISLEMRRLAVGRRILSGISGVSTRSMKSGYVQPQDWAKLSQAVSDYSTLPILFDDGAYDTEKLRAMLIWAKQEHGIRWFILDYALLLMDKAGDEIEQTSRISANLKRIVQDLDLAGIVIQSVNKLSMDNKGEPNMSDMRGSGQAIHDADLQCALTKCPQSLEGFTPQEKEKMVMLWVTKGRELERSRFAVPLCRRGLSPFWCEASTLREPEAAGRRDYE